MPYLENKGFLNSEKDREFLGTEHPSYKTILSWSVTYKPFENVFFSIIKNLHYFTSNQNLVFLNFQLEQTSNHVYSQHRCNK